MRGKVDPQSDMLCLISPGGRVPQDQPLRRIKPLLDRALADLSPLFEEMYAELGRPSIPPERLLKAKVLQALYTVRSETLLIEALEYNLLFRWFLDFNLLDPVWDHSTFSKNQDRRLAHQAAELFFAGVVGLAREHGIKPHIATVKGRQVEGLDGRTTRSLVYQTSQKLRKRVEEIFGWCKETGGLRRTRKRGADRVGLSTLLILTTYNLVRMGKLLGSPPGATSPATA